MENQCLFVHSLGYKTILDSHLETHVKEAIHFISS